MKQVIIETTRKKEVVDITAQIEDYIYDQKLQDGVVHIFVTSTTASITTADLDPGTDLDLLDAIEAMMPKLQYRHPHDPKHVVDHIASSIIGPSLTILVQKGEMLLGEWQRIVLIDLAGPRKRDIFIKSLA